MLASRQKLGMSEANTRSGGGDWALGLAERVLVKHWLWNFGSGQVTGVFVHKSNEVCIKMEKEGANDISKEAHNSRAHDKELYSGSRKRPSDCWVLEEKSRRVGEDAGSGQRAGNDKSCNYRRECWSGLCRSRPLMPRGR